MILCPSTKIYVGPPGCGKTTTLIKRVVSLLEAGVPPENIGYVSFTRQAMREAMGRIVAKTGLSRDRFPYFRTLHSMAYHLLGASFDTIVRPEEVAAGGDENTWLPEESELFSHLYNYHRVTGMSLAEVWELNYSPAFSGTEDDFLRWVAKYKTYKQVSQKLDFTDMLEEYVRKKPYLPFDWLFVDEGQDLTPTQWKMVQILAQNADNLVIAGDPDQSIFAWAGADGDMLERITGEREVLSQSYRVPKAVHIIAERILKATGREILYTPTPEAGSLEWCTGDEPYQLDYTKDSWYILARNNYYLKNISAHLYHTGTWYSHLGATSKNAANTKQYIRLIDGYGRWLTDEQRSMPQDLETACSRPKTCKAKGTPWPEAFDLWPVERTAYLLNTVNEWDSDRVQVGTFHAAKGGEADNVVLLGDTTYKIAESLRQGSIQELRALYVAVTRAKKRLYIVEKTRGSGISWNTFINIPQDLTNGLL